MSDANPTGDDVTAAAAAATTDTATDTPLPTRYVLSAVVYVERGDEILVLKRAEGSAMAGQWFLPGGVVEAGELPEEGARRELLEEAGVAIEGELEIVGCYPMRIYGHDVLAVSYRGRLAGGAEVAISHEHTGARWTKATDMRALMTDEVIAQTAAGRDSVVSLLRHIRTDLDRYLARVSSS